MNNNTLRINMQPARSFPDTQPNISFMCRELYEAEEKPRVLLSGYLNTTDDIFRLAMYVDVLRKGYGVRDIDLVTPRIPWDRMDRRMNPATPFSLKILADFLAALHLNSIYTLCPHSQVGPALIDNLLPAPTALFDLLDSMYVTHLQKTCPHLNLVSPDLGGVPRVKEIRTQLARKYPTLTTDIVVLSKDRCVEQDKVQCEVINFAHKEEAPYVVIDDLCDGGATFLETYKVLSHEYNNPKLHLCIAHGLFTNSVNFTKITGLYETVYCYAPFSPEHKEFPNLYVTDGCEYLIQSIFREELATAV